MDRRSPCPAAGTLDLAGVAHDTASTPTVASGQTTAQAASDSLPMSSTDSASALNCSAASGFGDTTIRRLEIFASLNVNEGLPETGKPCPSGEPMPLIHPA